MTLGSLFDGSGTCPLAATLCGITPVWASEIEEYPIRVTKKNFPDMLHLGDITRINGREIEPVDIICGGSPCQDLSVAGRMAGLEKGERSNLFYEMVRVIREMREATNGRNPRFVLWENVPGAFQTNKGRDFLSVLQNFAQIADPDALVSEPAKVGGKLKWVSSGYVDGDGWSMGWRTLDAQYWGVPQRRKRLLLILDLGGQTAGKVLFERTGLYGNPAEIFREELGSPRSVSGCADEANTGGMTDQPVYFDRAMYNQGINAAYVPYVSTDGIAATMVAKGPGGMCAKYGVPEDRK